MTAQEIIKQAKAKAAATQKKRPSPLRVPVPSAQLPFVKAAREDDLTVQDLVNARVAREMRDAARFGRKITPERRLALLEEAREQPETWAKAARAAKMSVPLFRLKNDPEFQQTLTAELARGRELGEVAKEFGLPKPALTRWMGEVLRPALRERRDEIAGFTGGAPSARAIQGFEAVTEETTQEIAPVGVNRDGVQVLPPGQDPFSAALNATLAGLARKVAKRGLEAAEQEELRRQEEEARARARGSVIGALAARAERRRNWMQAVEAEGKWGVLNGMDNTERQDLEMLVKIGGLEIRPEEQKDEVEAGKVIVIRSEVEGRVVEMEEGDQSGVFTAMPVKR